MSVIEDLYNGNISPVENMIPPDPNYREVCRKIGDEKEYFEGILRGEDKKRFKEWNSLIYEYEKMIELINFSNGFRLGLMLGFEVFNGEGGVRQEESKSQ